MSHEDDEEAARAARAKARASWPGRKMTLDEQPDIDIVPGTPEERFAMVWRITVDVWASSGRKIPDYRREDAPVTIIRGVRR